MVRLIHKIFIGLWTGLDNGSNRTKCLFHSAIWSIWLNLLYILINTVKNFTTVDLRLSSIDETHGSGNTPNNLSSKVRVSNKAEDLNLSIFNMIAGIIESKTLTKHTSCNCKWKFDEKNVI